MSCAAVLSAWQQFSTGALPSTQMADYSARTQLTVSCKVEHCDLRLKHVGSAYRFVAVCLVQPL